MDATMKRTRLGSIAAIAVSLALIPVVWMFALDAIPPLAVVRAETSGGRLGPWAFTWVLVWIATVGCIGVAWLSYASLVTDRTSDSQASSAEEQVSTPAGSIGPKPF